MDEIILQRALEILKKKAQFKPEIAVVLGSGLGSFADECIKTHATVDYKEIEGMPSSTVPAHKGRFIFGYISDIPVVIMQGRVHYYEGYDVSEAVMPIQLMGLMGACVLLLTNAAGAVSFELSPGDFMIIEDHISWFVPSPLRGRVQQGMPRYPDMSNIYDKNLIQKIYDAAEKTNIAIKKGIYLQTAGPQFETPAEIRMARAFGASALGMSTACEATAAHALGMKVASICYISNLCSGMTNNPITEEEVYEKANEVLPSFKKLVIECIKEFSENKGDN